MGPVGGIQPCFTRFAYKESRSRSCYIQFIGFRCVHRNPSLASRYVKELMTSVIIRVETGVRLQTRVMRSPTPISMDSGFSLLK